MSVMHATQQQAHAHRIQNKTVLPKGKIPVPTKFQQIRSTNDSPEYAGTEVKQINAL